MSSSGTEWPIVGPTNDPVRAGERAVRRYALIRADRAHLEGDAAGRQL